MIEARAVELCFPGGRGLFRRSSIVKAVRGVSLTIRPGEVLGLVGESGCGKTTLARLLIGLVEPTAGEIRIAGRDAKELGRLQRARQIQIVFQDPRSSLNPRYDVASIVSLPLRVHNLGTRREHARRVIEMINRVGLPERLLTRRPSELSGGQRQRVAIARSLIMNPRLLILDEPTSSLDVSVQSQILNLLQDLQRDLGLSLLIISHNIGVIQYLATRVAVMYLGRIVEERDVDAIFATPQHPYTRALFASVLTAEPGLEVPDPHIEGNMPDPISPPSGCSFHPRCPLATDVCRWSPPHALTIPAGGMVECHLYNSKGAKNNACVK